MESHLLAVEEAAPVSLKLVWLAVLVVERLLRIALAARHHLPVRVLLEVLPPLVSMGLAVVAQVLLVLVIMKPQHHPVALGCKPR
jgi:hypothetical protein